MRSGETLTALKEAAAAGRLAHALLLTGPSLAARLAAASELAQVVLCDAPAPAAACGECPQCHLMERRSHPDYRVLAPEEDAKSIKIEAVRALITEASFKPFQAKAKVAVIERAELMSESAQNAFLKTLEEPPGRMTFILIPQDAGGLLPTIRSRAQSFYYASSEAPAEAPDDPAFTRLRQELFARLADPAGRAPEFPELGRMERKEYGFLLDALIDDLRELLVLRAKARQLATSTGSLALRESWAAAMDSDAIAARIEALAEAKEKIVSQSLNAKLVMANLWLNFI